MKLFVWICVLILLSSTALLVGKYPVNFISLISGNGASPEDINTFKMIIINSRLPRILSALLIGGCLSAAGAVYQGIFRNPMVSPDMLGASSGSAFGAALAILFRFSIKGVEALSFASGIAAVAITWTISSTVSKARSSLVLILSGILVSTVFTSLLSLVKFTADPYSKLPDITFWLLGNLSAVSLSDTVFVSGCALLGFIPLFLIRWKINVLSLSEDEARALYEGFPGVRVVDDRAKNHFPMPLEASGEWDCLVGRIRKDVSMPETALNVFIAGDQLLKGAALNAVQIAALL